MTQTFDTTRPASTDTCAYLFQEVEKWCDRLEQFDASHEDDQEWRQVLVDRITFFEQQYQAALAARQ